MRIVEKRWGREEILVNEKAGNYCLKRLVLKPGRRCSMHRHPVKDETFYVERGILHVAYGDPDRFKAVSLRPGESFRVTPGLWHSFWSHVPTSFFESSTFDDPRDCERVDRSGNVIRQWAARWPEWPGNHRAIVIGDCMVDAYVHVRDRGRSREAHRLDYDYTGAHEEYLPGGALNVAATLGRLGMQVTCIGVVGEDHYSQVAAESLVHDGQLLAEPAFVQGRGVTTVKTRHVTPDGFPVHRVDRDRVERSGSRSDREVAGMLRSYVQDWGADIVLVADYGKGVVSPLVAKVLSDIKDELPVLIDPKPPLLKALPQHGPFFVVKPNIVDMRDFAQDKGLDIEEAAEMVCERGMAQHAVVTGGSAGAAVASEGRMRVVPVPESLSGRAIDVTGAGDEFLCVLAAEALGFLDSKPSASPRDVVEMAVASAVRHSSEAVQIPRHFRLR